MAYIWTKLKVLWFWVVSFYMIISQSMKGNEWHFVYADFHCGDDEKGFPIRKRLTARRTVSGLTLAWQDFSKILDK